MTVGHYFASQNHLRCASASKIIYRDAFRWLNASSFGLRTGATPDTSYKASRVAEAMQDETADKRGDPGII